MADTDVILQANGPILIHVADLKKKTFLGKRQPNVYYLYYRLNYLQPFELITVF